MTQAISIEGPGKGQTFFDRAKSVAETGNYDFAIEMYIQGLNLDCQSLVAHNALRDIALRRKVTGGKPAGGFLGPKGPFKGKTTKDHFLNAVWLLAKDPGNMSYMRTVVKEGLKLGLREIVGFYGPFLLMANRTQKHPRKDIYLELSDAYEQTEDYPRALEALEAAMELAPGNLDLLKRQGDLGAKHVIKKGRFDEDGDFTKGIKDQQTTKDLLQAENFNKSEDYKVRQTREAREAYEKNPRELQLISKYVKTLMELESDEQDAIAISVLEKAYTETKTYRYRFTIGDVRIKQMQRKLIAARDRYKAGGQDPALAKEVKQLEGELLALEIREYKDRTEHNPTDMDLVFTYGDRLFRAGQYDEALAALQQAQNYPKRRTEALYLLGRAFLIRGFKPEAIETLKRAIEGYELAGTGEGRSKEYFYWLGRALEENANRQEAIGIYSKIAQWDITYLDARKRLEALRNAAPGT